MRRFAVILILPWLLVGCLSVSIDDTDRVRMDNFIREWKRFNDSLDRVLDPDPPKKKISHEA
jgi:hypothetical protein